MDVVWDWIVSGGYVCWVEWSCVGHCSGEICFFFQAEDGIRDLVRSRGLGDVYKRQPLFASPARGRGGREEGGEQTGIQGAEGLCEAGARCLLYTSDAADERSRVDLGGRRILKKKKKPSKQRTRLRRLNNTNHVI